MDVVPDWVFIMDTVRNGIDAGRRFFSGVGENIVSWYRMNTQQANMLIFILAVSFIAGLVLGLMTSRIGLPKKKHHFSSRYLPGEEMAFSGDMDALISDHEEHSQQGI